MSIQDSIQDTFNEIDEFNYDFDKEMDEINVLIQNIQYYEKNEEEENIIKDLIPYFVYLCNFINNNKINSKEKRLIEYKKYFYSNDNLYYLYLNLLDFLVKVIILNC